MYSALTNKRLKKGIMQASPIEQTSCLEGFHSVLNQFSPKMIGYTYKGMFCRCSTSAIYIALMKNHMYRQLLGNLYQHLVGMLDIFSITIFVGMQLLQFISMQTFHGKKG